MRPVIVEKIPDFSVRINFNEEILPYTDELFLLKKITTRGPRGGSWKDERTVGGSTVTKLFSRVVIRAHCSIRVLAARKNGMDGRGSLKLNIWRGTMNDSLGTCDGNNALAILAPRRTKWPNRIRGESSDSKLMLPCTFIFLAARGCFPLGFCTGKRPCSRHLFTSIALPPVRYVSTHAPNATGDLNFY